MNRLEATVTAIECVDDITVIAFDAASMPMRMMALGLTAPLEVGSKVLLGVKASNISLAKGLKGMLSTSNQLDATIEAIKNGTLLCSVKLSIGPFLLESIITRASSERMQLQQGDTVTALIKSSELSIVEVLS